jgi:hypothetical protein
MKKYKINFLSGGNMVTAIVEASNIEMALSAFFRKNKGKGFEIIKIEKQ